MLFIYFSVLKRLNFPIARLKNAEYLIYSVISRIVNKMAAILVLCISLFNMAFRQALEKNNRIEIFRNHINYNYEFKTLC